MEPFDRLDHLGIVVADLDRAKRFVGGVLGLELSHEVRLDEQQLTTAFFAAGSVAIELIEVRDPGERAERLGSDQARIEHVAFETQDLDATARRLRGHDVQLRGGIGGDAPAAPLEIGRARNLFSVPATSLGVLLQFVERNAS